MSCHVSQLHFPRPLLLGSYGSAWKGSTRVTTSKQYPLHPHPCLFSTQSLGQSPAWPGSPQTWEGGPATEACPPVTPASGFCPGTLFRGQWPLGKSSPVRSGCPSLCTQEVFKHVIPVVCAGGGHPRPPVPRSGSLHHHQFPSCPCVSVSSYAKGRGRAWDPSLSHLVPPVHSR